MRASLASKLVKSFRPVFWLGVLDLSALPWRLKWGELMKLLQRSHRIVPVLFVPVLFVSVLCFAACATSVFAQRPGANAVSAKRPAGSYNVANDVSLQGTVLSYTENSKTPPLGTHVLLQTTAGNVDVHLGDPHLLHLAKLTITQGASVRFVGQIQTVGQSSVFLARLVQVGTQVVAVRSDHGMPLTPNSLLANKATRAAIQAQVQAQGGAR